MTAEEKFEADVIEVLTDKGWDCDHCESVNRPGWPDITATKGSIALLIEVKAGAPIRAEQINLAYTKYKNHGTVVWLLEKRANDYAVSILAHHSKFWPKAKHGVMYMIDQDLPGLIDQIIEKVEQPQLIIRS